jgi:uncharacterized lipoprotein NlpE involved in copper resistance
MKKTILALLILLLILFGCQQTKEEQEKKYYEDLPPPPPLPGETSIMAGKAIATAIPPWASPAIGFTIEPKEVFPDNPITLRVFEYQYIYQDAYYFNQKKHNWEKISLFGGERTEEWIKNSAATSFTADNEKFEYGDNYAVVYACNKIGTFWECNNNKWMINNFYLKEKPIDSEAPEKKDTFTYIHALPINSFNFQAAKSEEDNFGEIMVMRYDGIYYEPQTKLRVIVHVFEFNTMQDLRTTLNTFFKDIISQGWKTHNDQNVALYLDINDVRNTIWTSGNKLIFVETHSKEFASAEIINKYLEKFKSDLQKI